MIQPVIDYSVRPGRRRPTSVIVVVTLLYLTAMLQAVGATVVAATAKDFDRAWQALDSSGDFVSEADLLIATSCVWIALSALLVLATARLSSAGRVARAVVVILGAALTCGNSGWAALFASDREHTIDQQRIVDHFVPDWYALVPPPLLSHGCAASMIAVALVLLTSPTAREFFNLSSKRWRCGANCRTSDPRSRRS
jgi:hypothetical protein